MKKEINIPWEKAPKRVKGLAHVFVEFMILGIGFFGVKHLKVGQMAVSYLE